jgi:hypothetical protein
MASATIQYRVNGGVLHTDSIEVAGGDVIQLTAASFAGWQGGSRWRIPAFPPDWPCPDGWSTDSSSDTYYYLINSGPSGVLPPPITIPNTGDFWGKWLFQVIVNGTIVSAKIGVETPSPTLGLHDKAHGESTQFGGTRGYVGPEQENLRELDTAALMADGTAAFLIDAVATGFPAGVPTRAIPSTLNFAGAAGIVPFSMGYNAAAGSFGAAAKLRRVLASGGVDTSTGADLQWWIPNAAGAPVEVEQVRLRPVLTAVAGANLTTDFELHLVNAGAVTKTFTWHANGSVTVTNNIVASGSVTAGTNGFIGPKVDTSGATALAIGGTNATRVDLGRSGQTVRLVPLAGGGAQALQVDNNGDISGVGFAAAPANAAYLTVGSFSDLSAEVNVSALGTLLTFLSTTTVPLQLSRGDAAADTVEDALILSRLRNGGGGVGLAGIGPSLLLAAPDDNGDDVPAARIGASLTDVTAGAYAGAIKGWAATGGALTQVLTLGPGSSGLHLHAYGAGILHSDATGNITSSTIVNADVNAAAAIAGSKINPDFGAQNVTTTGTVTGSIFAGAELTPTTLKVAVDSPVTAAFNDIVRVDPSGGPITVNLPSPASGAGKVLMVFNEGTSTNTITITTPSGTINSAASKSITTGWGWMRLIATGPNGYLAIAGTGP